MLGLLCSSLWAGSCPTGVYKNHKTDSCSYSTESGDTLCYVFRRHPDFWEDQDRLPSKGKESNDTVTRVQFYNKYEEFNLRAHSADTQVRYGKGPVLKIEQNLQNSLE